MGLAFPLPNGPKGAPSRVWGETSAANDFCPLLALKRFYDAKNVFCSADR